MTIFVIMSFIFRRSYSKSPSLNFLRIHALDCFLDFFFRAGFSKSKAKQIDEVNTYEEFSKNLNLSFCHLHFVPIMFKTNCSNFNSMFLKQIPHVSFTESDWIISNVNLKRSPIANSRENILTYIQI